MPKLSEEAYREIMRLMGPVLSKCIGSGLIDHDHTGALSFDLRRGQPRTIEVKNKVADERNYEPKRNGVR